MKRLPKVLVLFALAGWNLGWAQSRQPQPGMYWDPEYPGMGFAVEVHGADVFLAAFSYSEEGHGVWYAGAGQFDDGQASLDLFPFASGPCIACGPDTSGNPVAIQQSLPVTLQSAGLAELALTLESGLELELQRFSLQQVQSEGSIAGDHFLMEDLSGRWLFTSLDGSLHRIVDLELGNSGIPDSYLAYFSSRDGGASVSCARMGLVNNEPAQGRQLSCAVTVDVGGEDVVFEVTSPGISHDRLANENFIGIRIQ